MNHSLAALKAQFDMHTRLFNNVLEGISDAEATTRNGEHINHIKWVAGHLADARLGSIARMTGGEGDGSYAAQFGRGVPLDMNANYPPLDEIKAKWNAASEKISNGISHIPDEVLAMPSPAKVPVNDETMLGLMAFLLSHEALHIGQLAILRKLAGKDAMSFK